MMDADGVVVDFTTPALVFLAQIGKPKRYEDVTQWDVFEGDSEWEDVFKETLVSKPGYCYNLKPLPGAIEFVRAAREKYDIAIVTTPYDVPNWYDERKDWLVDVLGVPRSTITFTHHKQYVDGDVFVDDKAENVFKWHEHWNKKRVSRLPVIMDQPWNRVELPKGVVRAVGFEDLSKRLEEFGLPRVF
jgi:5'(3')-deoxyribonucleotidase